MNFDDTLNAANSRVAKLWVEAKGRSVAAAQKTLGTKPPCYLCRSQAKLICTVEWEPPPAEVTEFVSVCVCSACAKRLREDDGVRVLRKYHTQGSRGCAVSVLKNACLIVTEEGAQEEAP